MINAIQFSNDGIEEVTALCEEIVRKNKRNEVSVKIAKGIADYVETNGFITAGQSNWLCRNADYWGITRPDELLNVVVEPAIKKSPVERAIAAPRMEPAVGEFNDRVMARFDRIEQLLEACL